MRFIGSKARLLPVIESAIRGRVERRDVSFIDAFCGTGIVSLMAKTIGKKVIANDNLYFCHVIAKALLEIDEIPTFKKLFTSNEVPAIPSNRLFTSNYERVLDFLNDVSPLAGFMFAEYSPGGTSESKYQRCYFSDENAKKIDAIRTRIDYWLQTKLITEAESCLLVSSLLRATNKIANIAGTYGAFLKRQDKRMYHDIYLEPLVITNSPYSNRAVFGDAQSLINSTYADILYLDPPYTWRHYGAYYHILETIARWDAPTVTGSTGLRNWHDSKSRFCDRNNAASALDDIIDQAQCRHLFLSYNSDGLIGHEQIISTLKRRGSPQVIELDFQRYRSNSGGSRENKVKERLYYVKTS